MPKFDKPFNQEMEAAVCGSIMIDGINAMRKISHLIGAKDFYYTNYKVIFEAYEALYVEHDAIDALTVADWLRNNGKLEDAGGPAFLTGLTNELPTAAHIVQYARAVYKYATIRNMMRAAKQINEMTQESGGDLDTILQRSEEAIKNVTREAAAKESKLDIADLADYMRIARENRPAAGVVHGLSTGFAKIDGLTGGFTPGELMIISGQTSHGKTQLANNIMYHVIQTGKKVMFITMEMTKEEMGDRFNALTDDEDIPSGRIFLNSHADLSVADVAKMVEKAKERGCDLVVIDHLHHFRHSIDHAGEEIAKTTREFKDAAVEYQIPVMLICHVRKMLPKQHPTTTDLRDTSFIAQLADIVLIVWRDESPNAKNPNDIEVVMWKNRSGRQKKRRSAHLYAQGIKLLEQPPVGTAAAIPDVASLAAGEKLDATNEDLLGDLPWE